MYNLRVFSLNLIPEFYFLFPVCLICCIVIVVASIGIYFSGVFYFEEESNYVRVIIDPNKILFETDEKFLSVALDTEFMECYFHKFNDSDWEKFENLSRLLSPAYLRLGGTKADTVIFNFDSVTDNYILNSTLCEEFPSKENLTITGEDWIKFNKFVQNSKLNLIIDLNVLLRKGSEWDSSNAVELIKFSEGHSFPLDFQLGNEPNSFPHVFNTTLTGSQLAADFYQLKKILNSTKIYKKSKLIGPDVTRPKNLNIPSLIYLEKFLSKGENVVDVVSWHQYYLNGRTATLEDFTSIKTLNLLPPQIEAVSEVVRRYSSNKPIWISETSSAYGSGAPKLSNRFVASFLWLDKLGVAARHNISVVIRQTLFKDHYALIGNDFYPNPDFWVSLLYKQLVGTKVLDVNVTQSGDKIPVRFYAHCIASNSSAKGNVVLYGMNLGSDTALLVPSGISILDPIQSYIFRPEFENLKSRRVLLNGELLVYNSSITQDMVKMAKEVTIPFSIPSYAIGFWVLNGDNISVCQK